MCGDGWAGGSPTVPVSVQRSRAKMGASPSGCDKGRENCEATYLPQRVNKGVLRDTPPVTSPHTTLWPHAVGGPGTMLK